MAKWWPSSSTVFGYELSPELVEAISEIIEQTRQDGLEHGVAVCVPPRSRTAYPGTRRCTGDACSVWIRDCGDNHLVGGIHSHPNGNPSPSLGDAITAAARKRDLRGSGLWRSLNCNVTIPRGQVAGQLTCIDVTPREDASVVVQKAHRLASADPLGLHGTLGAYWDLADLYDREVVRLYSDEVREAILADPKRYVDAHIGGWGDVFALLDPAQADEAMLRATVGLLRELAERTEEFVNLAREEEQPGQPDLQAAIMHSGVAAQMAGMMAETLEAGIRSRCSPHNQVDYLHLADELGRALQALQSVPVDRERRFQMEELLQRAHNLATFASSAQASTCTCTSGPEPS